jgi:hypothetical protein
MARKDQVPDGDGRKVFPKSTLAEAFYGHDTCCYCLRKASDAHPGNC